jgi:hypothetical protein
MIFGTVRCRVMNGDPWSGIRHWRRRGAGKTAAIFAVVVESAQQ